MFFASCRDCPSYIASAETVRYILLPAENNGFRRERNGVSRQENSFYFLIFLAAKKSSLHIIDRPEKVINPIIFRQKVDLSDIFAYGNRTVLLIKIKEAVHGRIGRRTVQSFIVVFCSKFMTLTFKRNSILFVNNIRL